jgi:hypothetical protein
MEDRETGGSFFLGEYNKATMTERGSIVEINKGLDIEGPQTMLEEVFKIMLNLEIESVLFLSVVIIV